MIFFIFVDQSKNNTTILNLKLPKMNSTMNLNILKVYWQGPFSIEDAIGEFGDNVTDYGFYQIYGTHNVNGADNLLYIGKSQNNILKYRFESHKKNWIDDEPSQITVYVGRFFDDDKPEDKTWDEYIDACEKMLIYHCQPSYNVREKYIKPSFLEKEYIILNIGRRHKLPAEISTFYFKATETFNHEKFWKYETQ